MYIRQYGAIDQSYLVDVVDESGLAVTDLVYNTSGLKINVGTPSGVVELTPVQLASLASPHTDRGFLHIKEGTYRIDLPDTYQVSTTDFRVWVSAPDCVGLRETVTLLRPSAAVGTSPTTPTPSGSQLYVKRGDTFTVEFTGLGNIADHEELWFTIKTVDNTTSDTDDDNAICQISEVDGLITVNGDALGSSLGSLTVTNAVTGSVSLVIAAEATHEFAVENHRYDVQVRRNDNTVKTLTEGKIKVLADTTRRVE